MVAPTGFGKTAVYVARALLAGKRCAILTSTRGQQKQVLDDFRTAGLTNISGRNNYVCVLDERNKDQWQRRNHPLTADEGVCNYGQPCEFQAAGCPYFDVYREAIANEQLVLTNYSYWLHSYFYGDGLGKFDLLVCDEAHDAAEWLSSFLSISLSWADLREHEMGDPPYPRAHWAAWAYPYAVQFEREARELVEGLSMFPGSRRRGLREAKHLKELSRRLFAIAAARGEWLMDKDDRGYRWDPVWPGPYAEELLFMGVPNVLLVSATIRRKTLSYLGIPDAAATLLEYPSSFPVSRRPVYVVPTVRLNRDSGPYELIRWRQRTDEIVGARLDRNGVIHTSSYKWRDRLLEASKNRQAMITNERKDLAETVAKFKVAPPPTVLVSPSVTTGYDFPGRECEYQIVAKINFPDMGSKVTQARMAQDRDFMAYTALADLVQATGRGMRYEQDRCETFIIDDAVQFLLRRHRDFTPAWWRDALRWLKPNTPVPPPPPRVGGS